MWNYKREGGTRGRVSRNCIFWMNQMHAAISQRLLHNSGLYAFRRSKFKLFESLHAKVTFTALRSVGHEITLWRHHEFRSRHNC